MARGFSFKKIDKWRYEIIAAINGAVIMVLELIGARIIAPHFGTSIYVWTAVIGVVLGALSLGYWYGGRIADRRANDRGLAVLIFLGAVVLLLSLATQNLVLHWAETMPGDLRLKAFVAALALFAPASTILGMVAPYLVKLKLTSLSRTGTSVGGLYAAGTVGSIVGTFLAGYWLIAAFGSRGILLGLVVVLVGNSLLASLKSLGREAILLVLIATGVFFAHKVEAVVPGKLIHDSDSAYSHLQIIDSKAGSRSVRLLVTDKLSLQSGVDLDAPDRPVFEYAAHFLDTVDTYGTPSRILLIGGGAYTLPNILTQNYPKTRVDVVEIDPKLDQLAMQYFGLKPDSRLHIIHEDGRTFLNNNEVRYDLLLMDAFNTLSPPFQLTTLEAVRRVEASMTEQGIAVVNIISARSGEKAGFLAAEYATYKAVFPYVVILYTKQTSDNEFQNFVLVATSDQKKYESLKAKLGDYFIQPPEIDTKVLTDDFAPVEQWNIE